MAALMRQTFNQIGRGTARWGLAAVLVVLAGNCVWAEDDSDLIKQIELLRKQNELLQQQLRQQQEVTEKLSRRVSDLEGANQQHASELSALKEESAEAAPKAGIFSKPISIGKALLTGEGSVGLFHSGSKGQFPNTEFRVDEAKLFVEAPVWDDVYVFSELNLAARENNELNLKLGEFYLDFENVSKLWGRDRVLNVRAGRFDIPFGEEYQSRDAIDNPLISHSLSDFWGVDEGVEFYGSAGKFSYVLAVQNGGAASGRDFTADKAVIGRVAFDPNRWLHLSVSGMRTGDLNVMNDYWSELWFANDWITAVSTNSTLLHGNLVEGDVSVRLPHGQLKAFGGYIRYGDNDPTANNSRDLYYYTVEGVHNITRKLYAGARFSQIFADQGYPIVGNGDFGGYFGVLTREIWRLSLGIGYRFSDHLLIKTEYTFERGEELNGAPRTHEDFLGAEAAFKF